MEARSQDINPWWKSAVIYQIYTRSFKDCDGDGIGDLRGVISKLEYIKDLGVDAVWLTPFFTSPMEDFGYDIANYYAVDLMFGSNSDVLELISKSHEYGIKVIFDMVFNHTSSEHPWFVESQSSLQNPKRNWYVWSKEFPNNWESIFEGPAWEKCPITNQYYYHTFLPSQPDLNLRNPEVIKELSKILRYYLNLGVDGFRLDAVNTYFEDAGLANNLVTSSAGCNSTHCFEKNVNTFDQEQNFDLIAHFRAVTDEFADKLLLGEVNKPGPLKDSWRRYYGDENNQGLDLATNFDLLYKNLDFDVILDTVHEWQSLRPQDWPTYALSSHDQIRFPSRLSAKINSYQDHQDMAKLLSTFLLTVRGTPFIYYGDELGLSDKTDLTRSQIRDPFAIRTRFQKPGRDGCRTPMLWDTSQQAGFSSNPKTWLPFHTDYLDLCVQAQNTKEDSILNHYKNLITFRKATKPLQTGSLDIIDESENVLIYSRTLDEQIITIVLNFSKDAIKLDLAKSRILLSNLISYPPEQSQHSQTAVSPFGFVIYE